jgi:NADH-quinone oxidoreductase subunit M
LLALGWALMQGSEVQASWAVIPLALAILVRSGVVPVHCWVTDWFEHASFGNALLFVAPLTGIYAIVRLILPIAPEWVLQSIEVIALISALYAAGMALVQRETRRFFAYLFLSHSSLVLVGVVLHTPISVTGALCLWFSVILSLGGFGLTIRAMEARFGRLTLNDHHGLYEHVPSLAVCFLLTGLASVGFPGTLGFVSTELLVDGVVGANLYLGLTVVAVAALNGSAVLRAYLLLFTGKRHVSTVSLSSSPWERVAVLTLAALILGGGIIPQFGVAVQYLAAKEILKDRIAEDDE